MSLEGSCVLCALFVLSKNACVPPKLPLFLVSLMWVWETAVSPHLSAFMAPRRLTLSRCLLNWDWSQQLEPCIPHALEKLCISWEFHEGCCCTLKSAAVVSRDYESHLFAVLLFSPDLEREIVNAQCPYLLSWRVISKRGFLGHVWIPNWGVTDREMINTPI